MIRGLGRGIGGESSANQGRRHVCAGVVGVVLIEEGLQTQELQVLNRSLNFLHDDGILWLTRGTTCRL
jgi:hypothetical protein